MQNRPLVIIAAAAAIIAWIAFQSLGGIEGIRAEPQTSGGVLAVLALIAGPMFWLQYRRLEREPIFTRADELDAEPAADTEFDGAPVILVASRARVLSLLGLSVAISAGFALLLWPRTAGCPILLAVAILTFAVPVLWTGVMRLLVRDRLEVAPGGLTHTSYLGRKHWAWDEVRNIVVTNDKMGGLMNAVCFERYVREQFAAVDPQPMLPPVWRISAQELAVLLNNARLRWTSSNAAAYLPARKTLSHYLPIALIFAYVAGLLRIVVMQPCGASS